jgi:5-(carboxyamino)imidazole ribonucleotide synthase
MNYIPKQKIGILGGGQLGRMLIQAALSYDVDFYVMDSDADCPCKDICHFFEKGSLLDFDMVYQFGKKVDILTIEIEHVNADALARLEQEGVKVIPNANAIRTIQNKALQKIFYSKFQIPTADFIVTETIEDVNSHVDFLPAFQKLQTLGYDGKGVFSLDKMNINNAFTAPSLLEKKVDIEKEISVIVAKNEQHEIAIFPVVECIYNEKYNLVDYLLSPASITEAQEVKAKEIALLVVEHLQSPGISAIELFLTKEGNILVNETAPRTHNSGHQTIEGNDSSQFDIQIRMLLNIPLGSTQHKAHSLMLNIIGDDHQYGEVMYKNLTEVLQMKNTYLHLYGKKETKPGRKMGHITLLGDNRNQLIATANKIKSLIKVIAK